SLLGHYLADEDERAAVAEAGRLRAPRFAFGALWDRALGGLRDAWPGVRERRARRGPAAPREALLVRAGQSLAAPCPGDDAALFADLEAAAAAAPDDAALAYALGLLRGVARDHERAAGCFGRAVSHTAHPLLPGLGLAAALALLGRRDEAADVARRLLALLDRGPAAEPVADAGPDLGVV